MKTDFPIRPKYFASHAIRNVDGAVAIERDDSRLFYIEIGIVGCYDGIIVCRGEQFLGTLDASWDNGVGV
jgi:hypothetical protein